MKYTENYNLKKPEPTDSYNIDDLNYNSDIVDDNLGRFEKLLKAEDISENFFVDVNSSYVFKEKRIYKQGNLINCYFNVEMLSESNQCWLDINPIYKPVTYLDLIVPVITLDAKSIPALAQLYWVRDPYLIIKPIDDEKKFKKFNISFSYMCQ